MKKNIFKSGGFQSLLASLLCIVLGLFLGYLVLLLINPAGAGEAILTVIKNFMTYNRPASQLKYFGNTLVKTAPLLMCALAILFAYKVGLFNIGAAGQYCAGVALSLYAALGLGWSWLPCMLLAICGGAILGGISGLLKSYCNVNEVISGIMLNWIVLYLTNMLLTTVKEDASPYTKVLAHINESAVLPSLGLGALFNKNQYVGLAIPLAVVMAVIVWIVLDKTKFGYELKATGLNKNAAKYCGMAEKRNIILSLMISGALAGTTYPLDRQFTAEKLGFAAPCANSLDGVSDRDFCIELANAISICMMHLSRLSEEIILWCSWEFKFIELDDAFTTGSSIMPQKKNPDVTELIRGKTGRVYGDLNTLLVMMKGIPLAYNKDMQEDKEAIFDAVDTLELCLKTVTPMLDTMKTLPANMRRAAAKGFINATDCADYLTKKGMPFRDAYKLTGCMVSDCIAKDKTLEELTLDEFKGYSALFENDIYDAIDLIKCCEGRTSYGGPSEASVNNQIRLAMDQLAAWEANNA